MLGQGACGEIALGEGPMQSAASTVNVPMGWEVQPVQPPHPAPEKHAGIMPKEDGIEAVFQFIAQTAFKEGWQVQPVQPPNPYTANLSKNNVKFAAIARGDDGIADKLNFYVGIAWQVQPVQPPALRIWERGAGMRGDDGIGDVLNFYVGIAWQIQPWQPRMTVTIQARLAALLPGDASDRNDWPPEIVPFAEGWQVQPWQPPNPQTTNLANQNKGAAIMRGDDGNEAPFIRFRDYGFAVQPWQPPHPTPEKRAGATMRGDDGNYDIERRFLAYGWFVQPWQPPHPHPEQRAGSIMPKDDGAYVPIVPPPTIENWEIQPPPPLQWPRRRIAGAIMRGLDGIDLPFYFPRWVDGMGPLGYALKTRPKRSPETGDVVGAEQPFPTPAWGWHQQGEPVWGRFYKREAFPDIQGFVPIPSVPPNAADFYFDAAELIRPQRRVPVIENEPSYVSLAITVPWGYDHQESVLLRRPRRLLQVDELFVRQVNQIAWGWNPIGYDHIRRPKRVVLDRDSLDLESPRPAIIWGWEPSGLIVRKNVRRMLPAAPVDLVGKFFPKFTAGWEIQSWQPPRFGRARAAASMLGDDGTQATVIIPHFEGWEPVLFWPPHPRPEKAGGLMAGDLSGAWGPFIYPVPSEAIAFDVAVYLAAVYDIGLPPPEFQEPEST